MSSTESLAGTSQSKFKIIASEYFVVHGKPKVKEQKASSNCHNNEAASKDEAKVRFHPYICAGRIITPHSDNKNTSKSHSVIRLNPSTSTYEIKTTTPRQRIWVSELEMLEYAKLGGHDGSPDWDVTNQKNNDVIAAFHPAVNTAILSTYWDRHVVVSDKWRVKLKPEKKPELPAANQQQKQNVDESVLLRYNDPKLPYWWL